VEPQHIEGYFEGRGQNTKQNAAIGEKSVAGLMKVIKTKSMLVHINILWWALHAEKCSLCINSDRSLAA
jgi:hypothetical protein